MKWIRAVVITLFICMISFGAPQKEAKATGIPVVDVANLAEAILIYLEESAQYVELVSIAQSCLEYYRMYEEYREEWEELISHDNFDELLREFGEGAVSTILTDELEEVGIDAETIFGSKHNQARRIYEKQTTWIHNSIKEINEVHETIAARQARIAALTASIDEETTEKKLEMYQTLLAAEQAAMQNEAMMIAAMQVESSLGIKALEIEESASTYAEK